MTHSRGAITALLARIERRPRQSLGQNFVADPNTVRRIVRLAEVHTGDHVVEIGAGLGSLTLALLEVGADVLAIEIDADLVPLLREQVEPLGGRVVHADATRIDWPVVFAEWGVDDAALVANLPYNVSTPLVCDLLDTVPQLRRMLVMVQRKVAERLVAGPGSGVYGIPSVKVAYWATARIVGHVPASVFVPQPKVESSLVEIIRRPAPAVTADHDLLFSLVRAGFGQRRKMLRRALVGLVGPEQFERAGIAPDARAESLGVEAWGALAKVVGEDRGMTLDGQVIIEVRCNEYTVRERNPHVPWSPEEIARDAAECREAGASIVHFHARDAETGAMSGDVEVYADTIRAIRAGSDVLVNPTLGASTIVDPHERVAHIPLLARDPATCPELAPVDLGSFNIDPYDPATRTFRNETLSYVTNVAGLRHEIDEIQSGGVMVQSVLWNVGSARLLGAFVEMGVVRTPVYAHVALAGTFLAAHPPTVRGLEALVEFLPRTLDLHWTFSAVGANALGLVHAAVEAGGHVSIGLGDYPYNELGTPTNAQLVAEVVRMVRAVGREPATPADVRAAFALDA